MTKLINRLKALEVVKDPRGELPIIVSDDCSSERIAALQLKGYKVFRESDPNLIEEFI